MRDELLNELELWSFCASLLVPFLTFPLGLVSSWTGSTWAFSWILADFFLSILVVALLFLEVSTFGLLFALDLRVGTSALTSSTKICGS
jgi:hypothetical protein